MNISKININKLVENLLAYLYIDYKINKKTVSFETNNNKNNVKFKSTIPITEVEYFKLKMLDTQYKNQKSKMIGGSDNKVLDFIKEYIVFTHISDNPIVLELLSKSGGNSKTYQWIMHYNRKYIYTVFNKERSSCLEQKEFDISNDLYSEIKNTYLKFINVIGLSSFPLNLDSQIIAQVRSEHPEIITLLMNPKNKHSIALFDSYSESKTDAEKKIYENLIRESDILMQKVENPLNIEFLDNLGIHFHITHVNYNYTYTVDYEGSYDNEGYELFLSEDPLTDTQISQVMHSLYIKDNGELQNYTYSTSFGNGVNENTYLEKYSDGRLITRPGNQRYMKHMIKLNHIH